MNLSDEEVELALFAVNDAITLRRKVNMRVPEWMIPLAKKFDLASLVAASGHESGSGERQLEAPVRIGTGEAADILGLSARQVRRLASELGGELVGRDWFFSRSAVVEYAEERNA